MNDAPPVSRDKWEDHKAKFLIGDLVETKHGLAVIQESNGSGTSYSVRHLPGWKYVLNGRFWDSAKTAWWDESELTLVEEGPMSKRRPPSSVVIDI